MEDRIWQAIVDCDSQYDGQFFYAVVSTRIFCRPSCRSKTPKRNNVILFFTPSEAVAAGFRPCKRCQPHDTSPFCSDIEIVNRTLQLIDTNYSEPLSLREMASRVHISPYHLHRTFRRITGDTPSDRLTRKRIEAAIQLLVSSRIPIKQIAEQAGYRNTAYFSSVFRKITGVSPTAYRLQQFQQKQQKR
ncbi:bifunctional transcriptional activator/DNA repair enzyme AdaA [Effusibacillus dendaii]|uniref:bifunctional transcriptional activator/DNA repair enzyme AdaA n=1 Tax=Effusibacillus dendaii TaxID=2743772 RepID=UPI00190AF216|nr:Ada metal-binding domain-containing protein [Effusibacillus dendaii]